MSVLQTASTSREDVCVTTVFVTFTSKRIILPRNSNTEQTGLWRSNQLLLKYNHNYYENRLRDVIYGFQIQDIRICMGLTIIFPIRYWAKKKNRLNRV